MLIEPHVLVFHPKRNAILLVFVQIEVNADGTAHELAVGADECAGELESRGKSRRSFLLGADRQSTADPYEQSNQTDTLAMHNCLLW